MNSRAILLGLACFAADGMARAQGTSVGEQRMADLDALTAALLEGHPDPFQANARENWEQAIDALAARFEELDETAYFLELSRIVGLARDGHTSVLPPNASAAFTRSFGIELELCSDGLLVAAADAEHAAALGRRVLAFGEVSAAQAMKRLEPFLTRDNDLGSPWLVELLLVSPAIGTSLGLWVSEEQASIQVESEAGAPLVVPLRPTRGGPAMGPRPTEWSIAAYGSGELPLWARRATEPWWYEEVDDGRVGWLRFASVVNAEQERFADFCSRTFEQIETSAVQTLVVDLRGNRGGNNYLTQPLLHGLIKSRLDAPGRLFCVTDRRTFSAAVNAATRIERETWALFVGEPMGGRPNHFGDAEEITLPGTGSRLFVSSVRWQDSDPRDARPWIRPDVPAPIRIADRLSGRDPALEAVLAFDPAGASGRFGGLPPIAHWMRASQGLSWPPH